MTTRSRPSGTLPPSMRSTSRSSRLARLRATAPPILRLTTKPARVGPPSARLATYSTTDPLAWERPVEKTDRKAVGELSLARVAMASGREPLAPLGASAGQDRAAGTGAHPQPEAVRLGALASVGLERSLHDIPQSAPGKKWEVAH